MERKITDWGGSIVAILAVLLVNYLSNAIPLGGMTQKDISDLYPSLFTPASFTFAIWGVIYLALAGFVIYQALPAQRNNALVARISQLFILSCVANIAWIFCWHYGQLALSLAVMLAILFILVTIYRVLGIANRPASLKEQVFLHLPFSLYTGWITVATVANLSILQTAYGLDNLGIDAVSWTLLKLAAVAAIAALVIILRNDMVYGLVIAWAAFGIMSKQTATPAVSGSATVLVAVAVMLVTFVGIRWLLRRE
ncbi:MAG: TspO/MBR family protein [Thiolinea sp.]